MQANKPLLGRCRLRVVGAAAAMGIALTAVGQAPIEESNAASGYPATSASGAAARTQGPAYAALVGAQPTPAAEGSRLSDLFYQLQVLQQEVQELRGIVEEQSHQLNRLARDQQEQYLDLDRRMQAVRASAPQSTVGAQSAPTAGGGATPAAAAPGSERDAYTAAFSLMKARQFDASTQAFNQLIANYPNGEYTANSFYWLGELYLAQDEPEKARQSFTQVINLFPDHQKVPDALYKLGVVYHRLGDTQRAREYLNRTRSEFPQSSAAGLAQTYLAELQ